MNTKKAVLEDVRLQVPQTSWDGSYRKAENLVTLNGEKMARSNLIGSERYFKSR